jgi:hypothetical protein
MTSSMHRTAYLCLGAFCLALSCGCTRDRALSDLERRVAALEEKQGTPKARQEAGLFVDEVSGTHLDLRSDGKAFLKLNATHQSEGSWRKTDRGVSVTLQGIGGGEYAWEGSDLVGGAQGYRFTPQALTRR